VKPGLMLTIIHSGPLLAARARGVRGLTARAHAAERPSNDGGDTVLMSRNVPGDDDKPAPAILKAPSAAPDIDIQNEDDWAVLDDDEDDAAAAAAAGAAAAVAGTAPAADAAGADAADGAGAAPAAADGAKDPLWEEAQRTAAQQRERKQAEADKLVRAPAVSLLLTLCARERSMLACESTQSHGSCASHSDMARAFW
jgi:hypothetical protein